MHPNHCSTDKSQDAGDVIVDLHARITELEATVQAQATAMLRVDTAHRAERAERDAILRSTDAANREKLNAVQGNIAKVAAVSANRINNIRGAVQGQLESRTVKKSPVATEALKQVLKTIDHHVAAQRAGN